MYGKNIARQSIHNDMKKVYIFKSIAVCLLLLFASACSLSPSVEPKIENKKISAESSGTALEKQYNKPTAAILINEDGKTIEQRIKPPQGFERIDTVSGSFEEYLRSLTLKPHGSKVMYYNGEEKIRQVYEAVIDIEIGNRDLQQCADAVMRLRAEYLYKNKQYDKIHFNFTNGFNAEYRRWKRGERISVKGSKAVWIKKSASSDSYDSFRRYLDMVFAYAGTQSLEKEMKKVSVSEMKIGDVFITGGSPGHCVIVVDMAENQKTGEKLFMLAQSYMPAQDIHILKNPSDDAISPWYKLDFGDVLNTPEWTFEKEDLKGFS